MAIESLEQIRRVVSGERENGASYVALDGPPGKVRGRVAVLWASDYRASIVPVRSAKDDPAPTVDRFMAGPGDTRFVAMWLPPDSERTLEAQTGIKEYGITTRPAGLKSGGGWHATYTFDYAIVIQGDLWCELDEGEVHLRPGDVFIQGGAAHVWHNYAGIPTLVYLVNVGVCDAEGRHG